MTSVTEPEPSGRRPSSILNAILDRVEAPEERTDKAAVLFRARALEQLDVAVEIDNQLPLVSRRTWLVIVGVVLLCLGALVWAGFTPTQTTIVGDGRMVAPIGVANVSAPVMGTVASAIPQRGAVVSSGDVVTSIAAIDADVPVTATVDGSMWQVLSSVGDVVSPGATLATVLPLGSERTALVPLAEGTAATVRIGMAATIGSGSLVEGQVSSLTAPLPPAEAAQLTGLPVTGTSAYVVVAVTTDADIPAGTQVRVRIIQSEQSVLSSLLSGGA